MDFLSQLRYKTAIIIDISVLTLLYVFLIIDGSGKSFESQYGVSSKTLVFIGYILWTMSINVIASMTSAIEVESKNGTLQNVLNSKYPMEWILFSEFISSQFINLIVIFAIALVSKLFFKMDLMFSPSMILPIIICILGMFGIGLILAGISLLIKKVNALILFLQVFLLFISNTIPTNEALLKVSQFIPLTMANDVTRRIAAGDTYSKDLLILFGVSVLFVFFGDIIFRYLLIKAKKKDILLLN